MSALLMCHSPPPLHPLHLQCFRLVCFSNFLINGEALHPTGLCLIWFRATIFNLDPILPCSVTSSTLMSRQLQLIILLFRRKLMSFLLREQQNPSQVVLVSILACFWYHTGGLHPILNLKCFNCFMYIPSFKMPTLKMYSSLSSRVILLFPLIYRMLIYMFPLLSIIIVFMFCLV